MARSGSNDTSEPLRVAVIGAGWAGCTAARVLHDEGCTAHVFEAGHAVGGHSRAASVNGVLFELEGPHIFHTSNPDVARFVQRFGMRRPYVHHSLTEVILDDDTDESIILSWPLQVEELRNLPTWEAVEKELAACPPRPGGENLESYCVSMRGPTLYRLFIEGYTMKQWGRHPSDLSSRFAPSRLDLRTDGDRRLFRDSWEFFPADGPQATIENITRPLPVTFGQHVRLPDVEDLHREFDAVVITAPLDDFVGVEGALEWRGIRSVSQHLPLDDPAATVTPGYVVNQPSLRRAYTRTVETKHATGQTAPGTVVTREYPGAPRRHYPVPTVDMRYERRDAELQDEIRSRSPLVPFFCGRLANYTYVNQDVAIGQGMITAREVLAHFGRRIGGGHR